MTTETGADQKQENVLYEVKDHVALITMNRPERLNALGRAMREDIGRAMRAADEDSEIRCIVWTGSGRAFSSGADMSGALPVENLWDWYRFSIRPYSRDAQFSARDLQKVVIAAVNGLAYGAGLIALTECDIVIASDRARFCMIEARMGSSGASNLPFLVGPQWAKILMLTGEAITARRAERIGLVGAVVPHDRLLERALDMARRVAAMPRYGVMLNKAEIDGAMDMMGWLTNERFSRSHGAITNTMAVDAEAANGRQLQEVFRTEGFAAWRDARDAAFKEPWFKEDEQG